MKIYEWPINTRKRVQGHQPRGRHALGRVSFSLKQWHEASRRGEHSQHVGERAGRQEPSPLSLGPGAARPPGLRCGGVCFRAAYDPATPREMETGARSTA